MSIDGEKQSGGNSRRGPETIEAILKRWLRKNRVSTRVDKKAIYERWSEVVGEEIARHTRVVDLNSGELIVEVNSAALLQELSTYYRDAVLQSLQEIEDFKSIRKIRFRVGSFQSL